MFIEEECMFAFAKCFNMFLLKPTNDESSSKLSSSK